MKLNRKDKKKTYILQEDLFFGVKYNKEVFVVEKFQNNTYLIVFWGITINPKTNSIEQEKRRTIATVSFENGEYIYINIPSDIPKGSEK